MTIRKGTGTIKRVHARNFTQKQANKRFDEAIRPYQQQGLNALGVDYFEVNLYQRSLSTQICTCKQTEVTPMHSNVSVSLTPNVINPHSTSDSILRIDYARPLFGGKTEATDNLDYHEHLEFAEDDDSLEDYDEDEIPTRTSENLFSSNADCGICYRTGYVPGYHLYGFDRHILATHSMTNVYGYTVNQGRAPHRFEKVDDREGFVEFTFNVPRYFKKLRFSVRNNNIVLSEEDIYMSTPTALSYPTGVAHPLSIDNLRYAAGTPFVIRVLAEEFTHVVLEFDLGVAPLHANIAQMSKNLDWTNMDTLGNMNVILPMTIQEVQSSDFIHVPSRNQVLKITDTPFLRTAKDKTLDWSVNCRICQPMEPAKKIHVGRCLL
jgi:hypothetical protein